MLIMTSKIEDDGVVDRGSALSRTRATMKRAPKFSQTTASHASASGTSIIRPQGDGTRICRQLVGVILVALYTVNQLTVVDNLGQQVPHSLVTPRYFDNPFLEGFWAFFNLDSHPNTPAAMIDGTHVGSYQIWALTFMDTRPCESDTLSTGMDKYNIAGGGGASS